MLVGGNQAGRKIRGGLNFSQESAVDMCSIGTAALRSRSQVLHAALQPFVPVRKSCMQPCSMAILDLLNEMKMDGRPRHYMRIRS